MKCPIHADRKSYKKQNQLNQLLMTETKYQIELRKQISKRAGRNYLVVGRNGYKESRPQAGSYNPRQKAPSRRDIHRAMVAERNN